MQGELDNLIVTITFCEQGVAGTVGGYAGWSKIGSVSFCFSLGEGHKGGAHGHKPTGWGAGLLVKYTVRGYFFHAVFEFTRKGSISWCLCIFHFDCKV